MSLADEIKEMSMKHPNWDAGMLANHFGCKREYVRVCAQRHNFSLTHGKKNVLWTSEEVEKLCRLRGKEGKRWGDVAKALNRPRSSCQHKYEDVMNPSAKSNFMADRTIVPEDRFADRNIRVNLAPRDLTAAFFGDPKPGFSALERRT